MSNENNQILEESYVDDMARQVYNTMKILYTFKEEEKERIVKQLIKEFLKPYIKIKDHVITKESSGS